MKDELKITTESISVTILEKEIVLEQTRLAINNRIVLTWQAFAKLSDAAYAITQAHAKMWRVNHPEETK